MALSYNLCVPRSARRPQLTNDFEVNSKYNKHISTHQLVEKRGGLFWANFWRTYMSFNPALLNQNSVKKFVDRLEKVYSERFGDTPVKRTQLYEDIAHLFGYDSWHNMDQAMKSARSEDTKSTDSEKVIWADTESNRKSVVLHLLQNTKLSLTDAVVQNQIMGILRAQSTEDMLQSCREISRFITHNHNDNSNLVMDMAQKISNECPEHFDEAREEIIKILSGMELCDFILKTNTEEKEDIKRTDKYLSAARVVMKRLDYIAQPFVSQRCEWTFGPLAAERLTSFEQIAGVLEKLKGELEKMPEKVKNAPDDVKRGVYTEIMQYVYGEHGILYRAQQRYPDQAKYQEASQAVDRALGITPNFRLKKG